MSKLNAIAGALAIMMAAGAILDFELWETDSEFFVRIWSPRDLDRGNLRKHVAALLPAGVEERHVTIVE